MLPIVPMSSGEAQFRNYEGWITARGKKGYGTIPEMTNLHGGTYA